MASNEKTLAQKIMDQAESSDLIVSDGIRILKLPMRTSGIDPKEKLRRLEIGEAQSDRAHRHMLLTGMTGSGKSLLINTIVNKLFAVTFKDSFRFKVIVESEELEEREDSDTNPCEAESMTSWVTCYSFHWQEGFGVPYSLTIIDTPGFGDTRGLEHDESIVRQIRMFYNNPDLCPTTELSCVGLVVQGSQSRITEEQKYIFGQVLNLFGKDMKESIFINFTYADRSEPPALKVIKSNDIPFNERYLFKFNNYAIYEDNRDMMVQLVWDFGYQQLDNMFRCLEEIRAVDLAQTKQVLHDREQLRLILDTLADKISRGMDMLSEIETHSKVIVNLDGKIDLKRRHKIKSTTYPQKISPVYHSITNCITCMFTCHDPCGVKGDLKERCAAIDKKGGFCKVCPGRCSYKEHTNGDRAYSYPPIEREETIEEMAKHYNVAVDDKNAKRKLLLSMLAKYNELKQDVFDSIQNANNYSNQLEATALRFSYLNNISYIDRLIDFEGRSARNNKQSRLQQLRHMRSMAEILQSAKGNSGGLTGSVSEYEVSIMKIVESIKDEEELKPEYVHREVTASTSGATGGSVTHVQVDLKITHN